MPSITITVVKRDFLDIAGVKCARVMVDLTGDQGSVRQVYYVMPMGSESAMLAFTTDREHSDGLLPVFDASAKATQGVAPTKRN